MSYDTVPMSECAPPPPPPAPSLRREFLRHERLVFLVGAVAIGGVAGFVAVLAVGRQDYWTHFLAGAPILAIALCLTCATYVEARARRDLWCSLVAACNAGALILWPAFTTLPPLGYALAPGAALLSALVLVACWRGSSAATYRAGGQAVLVAALAAHQGVLMVFGG